MATVKAVYNYSYNYEGAKITFRKGEEFQLLSKANQDWWQVRRWKEGSAQDIYVPAVYVKEVEEVKEENPLYENITDLAKKLKENGDVGDDGPQYDLPVPKPKKDSSVKDKSRNDSSVKDKSRNDPITSPLHHAQRQKPEPLDGGSFKTNGFVPKSSKVHEDSVEPPPSPSRAPKRVKSGKETSPPIMVASSSPPKSGQKPGIKDGWIPTYALPPVSPKLRSKSVNVDVRSGLPPTSPTESSLDRFPRASSPAQAGGGKNKIPPPVLPKSKQPRPVSMVVTTQEQSEYLEESEPHSTFLSPAAGKHPPPVRQEQEKPVESKSSFESLGIRKTPSPKTSLDESTKNKRSSASSLQSNGSLPRDSTSSPSAVSPLPDGWSEHKTSDGRCYYHSTLTGESSWTRPLEASPSPTSTSDTNALLERVAPSGWTKEINTFTSTPIYTNCHNGERWALARDGSGNYYYYNMANSSLTVGELPAILPSRTVSEPANSHNNIYDRLSPPSTGDSEPMRARTSSDPKALDENPSPKHQAHRSSQPVAALTSQLEMFASSLSVLKKHGYLQRKRLYDAQGKKANRSWQKLYVVLQDSQLFFYTDHKVVKEQPGGKPLVIFPLLQASVSQYNKEKKKNVFQVSSSFGEQFLLQAETSPLMNDWYSTIQTAIDRANQDFKEHPERYKGLEQSLQEGDGESSPKLASRLSGHKRKESKDFNLDQDEYDPMDDTEISAADKSVRIRSRLKKLMAKRPQLDTLKKSGTYIDPTFGCELGKLYEREKSTIPRFLTHFMEHIEQHGLSVVGIYRLSGNAASVQKLRFQVEQDQVDLDDPQWADINIVTGCLKLFLRELPDSVIPMKTFRSFIEAARLGTHAQRIAAIAARVKELPVPNYHMLKALVLHFRKVVEQGHINKMQATNVAIVFGPTLMRSNEGNSLEIAALLPVQNGIVELMIKEFETIFRK